MTSPFKCTFCNKQFKTSNSRKQHEKAKHHSRLNVENRSIASLVREAQIDAAMGDPVDDWLGDMFYDDIYGDQA